MRDFECFASLKKIIFKGLGFGNCMVKEFWFVVGVSVDGDWRWVCCGI